MTRTRVAICIITLARPRGLERLLLALDQLVFAPEAAPDVRILVVENDESGRARKVCEEVRHRVRWPISFAVEPRRGIPFARNTAIALARRDTDFIAFIDDDEVPEPGWLAELLRVQGKYEADVVGGEARALYGSEPPVWAITGGFFEGKRRPTGHRMTHLSTDNALFRASLFDEFTRPFDERVPLAGGTDTHFTTRLHLAGRSLVWAHDACVRHVWPESRLRLTWLIERSFRVAANRSFIAIDLNPPGGRPAWLLAARALARIGKGLLRLPTVVFGRHHGVAGLVNVSSGVGQLRGLTGYRHEEYRTIHGD